VQSTLAQKLRLLRAERGLTLRQAEKRTGVDKDTLSKLERGVRHPYDITLSKIAHGYGVPVEELLGEPALAKPGKADAPRGEDTVELSAAAGAGAGASVLVEVDKGFAIVKQAVRGAGLEEEVEREALAIIDEDHGKVRRLVAAR
jgi:transcriptional regulator with XRE-family HTH domain